MRELHRHPATTTLRPPPAGETGTAIVLALIFAVVAMGLVVAGTSLVDSTKRRTEVRFAQLAQARQFARSGLNEALAFFRRQKAQPVVTFAPQRDELANPPVLDTEEPEIGLVREFKITDHLWGRYEVWKRWDSDPDPARKAWRQQFHVEDVSSDRVSGPGTIWRVISIGYIFERRDPLGRFDEQPNRVVATETLETEIRRVALSLPGQAALSVAAGGGCVVETKGRIIGGSEGAGIFYPEGTGTPTTGPLSEDRVTGTPRLAMTDSYDDSPRAIFGMTEEELRRTADFIVHSPENFPVPVPDGRIVYVDAPEMRFDGSVPLRGFGVVYVKGNASFVSGSNSFFSGLLHVDGDLMLREPADLYGGVICTGDVMIQGGADFTSIHFDDDVIDALQNEVGQYRFAGAMRRVHAEM